MRVGGHCDPWALSPGMQSSRCPADTAAMGHLGTGISWCPNKTEVKTRLQHGQQGSRLWARVQIKTYRGRRHLSDTTVMLGDSIEKGIQARDFVLGLGDPACPQSLASGERLVFRAKGADIGKWYGNKEMDTPRALIFFLCKLLVFKPQPIVVGWVTSLKQVT